MRTMLIAPVFAPSTTTAHGARPSWASLDAQRRFDLHLTDHIHHSCLALHA